MKRVLLVNVEYDDQTLEEIDLSRFDPKEAEQWQLLCPPNVRCVRVGNHRDVLEDGIKIGELPLYNHNFQSREEALAWRDDPARGFEMARYFKPVPVIALILEHS